MELYHFNQVIFVYLYVFTSHQQLRSYRDRATALSLIRQTGEARDQTRNPRFTRWVIYPLNQSGSSLSHVTNVFKAGWFEPYLFFLSW